jgi:hypothetical protein
MAYVALVASMPAILAIFMVSTPTPIAYEDFKPC